MNIDEKRIADIVMQVLKDIDLQGSNPQKSKYSSSDGAGVFGNIKEALTAAKKAQQKLAALSLGERGKIVQAIREASIANVEKIARIANEETGYGRVPDKIQKKLNASRLTPGIEDLKVEAKTGDCGLVMIERVPYGLIASIEPATHPGSCVINHAISMVAAGNGIIFLPHPKGVRTTKELVRIYNKAIVEAGGPENLLVVGNEFSDEIFETVITAPEVDLIVATGGPFVVDKALRSGKKAIAAGPGNPPVIVDDTVKDMKYAAQCIVDGASFDNTVLCIAEKVVFVFDTVADELLAQMRNSGAYIITDEAVKERVVRAILPDGKAFNGEWVGKNADLIMNHIGVNVPSSTRLIVMEVNASHPLVNKEQLMPVLPVVRVKDFEEALALAVKAENNCRHTAVIHSSDVDRITRYAKTLKVDIMVANAASGAGLNVGGEGHYSHTIASPTGEGICTPRTYTREQRTVIVGSLYTA